MGFGYNPNLERNGERIDMFNFFAWMLKLQEIGVSQWFIWDASGFYVVNRIPKKRIDGIGKPNGKKLLELIINEQDGLGYGEGRRNEERKELKKNWDLRSVYLKRLIKITEINGLYLDSRVIFRTDPRYATALDIALDCVEKLKKDNPETLERILPANSNNPASWLYLPLEMAEAIYFQEVMDVEGKFGPKSEEYFDTFILAAQEGRKTPYMVVWCPLGPSAKEFGQQKPAYLSDIEVLWTKTPKDYVADLLENSVYQSYVRQYAQMFQKDGETLLDCVMRLKRRLNSIKK
ncbi:hypothetical protein J4234_02650 [Candidatus Woesearchaeota archaeon]|nr:hypothetical protein [Candidatus Woesearchaeota archaeon]